MTDLLQSTIQYLLSADEALFKLINLSWRNSILDAGMPFITLRIPWIILFLGIFSVILYRARHSNLKVMLIKLLLLLICIGLCDMLTNIVKDAVGRPRPCIAVEGAFNYSDGEWETCGVVNAPLKSGVSFFSAHAANSAAFAVAVGILFPYLRPFIYLVPLIVGYSRIYLGRHYPLDILVGWLAGIIVACLVCRFAINWLRQSKKHNAALAQTRAV